MTPMIPETRNAFVVDLHHLAPLEGIDAHRAGHKKNYAEGRFALSGQKVPRTVGTIIAVSDSRASLETVLRDDPSRYMGWRNTRSPGSSPR